MEALLNLYREAYRGLPRHVWMLSIVLLINRSGTMVLPFLVIFLKFERGYSAAEAGMLMSVYGIGAIAGSMCGGWLAVRVGSIRTQLLSLIASAPLFVSLGYMRDWQALAINLLALSVIAEAVRPASVAATTEYSPDHLHRKSFALNRLAVNLGMTLGPTIGGLLYAVNFQLLFWVDGATCLFAAGLLFTFFRFGHPLQSTSEHRASMKAARKPWQDSLYVTYLIVCCTLSIIFFQVMSTYTLYLKEHYGFNEAQIGLLLASNTVVIVAIEMVVVQLLRSVDDLVLVAIGSVLTCLGFGLTPFGSGALYCLFGIMIWTMGEMLMMPFSMAFVSRRANRSNRGLYLGMYTMSYSIAFVVAPIVGTRLYDIDPRLPWIVSLCAGLPIFFIFLAIGYWARRDEAKREENATGAAASEAVSDAGDRSSSDAEPCEEAQLGA